MPTSHTIGSRATQRPSTQSKPSAQALVHCSPPVGSGWHTRVSRLHSRPAAQALLEDAERGWQHENADRILAAGSHLTGALDVDDEHQIASG